jgi:hypothetical protein
VSRIADVPTVADLQDVVSITSVLTAGAPTGVSFATVAIVAEFGGWGTDRWRTYSSLAALEVDFAYGTPVYAAGRQFFAQASRPPIVGVGRRDPGDPSWTSALTAIRAASSDWYGACFPEARLEADLLEIGAWANAAGMQLVVLQTADADVLSGAGGNLAEVLGASYADDNAGRVVLIWHDPQTASGAAAPTSTITTPAVGSFALSPGGTLSVTAEAGSESATLAAAPASEPTTTGAPWVLQNLWRLNLRIDGGASVSAGITALPATQTGTVVETFNITSVNGLTVEVVTDTGTDSYVIDSTDIAVYPTPAAATAAEVRDEFLAGIASSVALATASGGVLTVRSATSGSAGRFRFTAATPPGVLSLLGLSADTFAGSGNVANVAAVTAAEMSAITQAVMGSSGTATVAGAEMQIDGRVFGTAGSVEILGSSTAGLLTELGLSAGITYGTGDVQDASQVSLLELDSWLSANFTHFTTTLSGASLVLDGVAGVGQYHTLLFGGSLRAGLGLPKGQVFGAGVEDDYADACVLAARLGIDIDTRGLVPWDKTPLVGCFGDTFAPGVSLRLRRDDNVNTIERRNPLDSRPLFMDGRLLTNLQGSSEPVYVDARIGIDWLGVRLQEALAGVLFSTAAVGTGIPYLDRPARSAILTSLSAPLQAAALLNVISEADVTPPDASVGKLTGLDIAYKASLPNADRQVRRWAVTSSQRGAGFLQGIRLINQIENA